MAEFFVSFRASDGSNAATAIQRGAEGFRTVFVLAGVVVAAGLRCAHGHACVQLLHCLSVLDPFVPSSLGVVRQMATTGWCRAGDAGREVHLRPGRLHGHAPGALRVPRLRVLWLITTQLSGVVVLASTCR